MKKKVLIIITIILLIVIAIFTINTIQQNQKSNFALDSEEKILITTNTKRATAKPDGGSHINIYYQIDLNKNTVTKCEDKYIGFKGYEYEGKILSSKQLNEKEKIELQIILGRVIDDGVGTTNEKDENSQKYYITPYYTVTLYNGEEIKIYSEEIIKDIDKLLN